MCSVSNILEFFKRKQKGQGIVEYALLLAFVVGIAMMLNGANLGGAVKGAFDDVASVLGGEIKENAYVAGFKKWSTMKKSDLENEDAAARLAADQAALDNIAMSFFGKTQEQLKSLTGQNMYANGNKNFYGTTDGQNDGPKGDEYGDNKYSVLLMNYKDNDTQNASGIDIGYKTETYLNTGWLQGTDRDSKATSNQDWKNTSTNTRYFYSDGMINNAYGSQVRAQFHIGSDGTVDSVRVFAVQDRNKNAGVTRYTLIEGLDRTYDSNGAHATN